MKPLMSTMMVPPPTLPQQGSWNNQIGGGYATEPPYQGGDTNAWSAQTINQRQADMFQKYVKIKPKEFKKF